MKIPLWAVILIWLTCWPAAVLADPVYEDKDREGVPLTLRITEEPCTNPKVRSHLTDRLLDDRRFKRSILTWKGEELESCYAEQDDTIYSIDSDGDRLNPPVPRSLFRDRTI